MRDDHDFSKGKRGKFYHPDARLNLSIYLDDEVMAFVERIARQKGTDMSSVVNKLLRGDTLILEAIE